MPISSIDHRTVGGGGIGPLTQKIRETYFDVAKGRHEEFASWLTRTY